MNVRSVTCRMSSPRESRLGLPILPTEMKRYHMSNRADFSQCSTKKFTRMINVIDVFSRYTKDYSVIFYKKKGKKMKNVTKFPIKKVEKSVGQRNWKKELKVGNINRFCPSMQNKLRLLFISWMWHSTFNVQLHLSNSIHYYSIE